MILWQRFHCVVLYTEIAWSFYWLFTSAYELVENVSLLDVTCTENYKRIAMKEKLKETI